MVRSLRSGILAAVGLLLLMAFLPGWGHAQTFPTNPQQIADVYSGPDYLKASNTDAGDQFGNAIAADGNTLVVGAPLEDSGSPTNPSDDSLGGSGAVYVFVRDGSGIWMQQAYLKASNLDLGDSFGEAVAISGDTIVVGAPSENSSATGVNGDQSDDSAFSAGAAYVFVRDENGDWSQQAYLKASNTDTDDRFGHAVAISADTIVIGAPQEDSFDTGVDGNELDDTAPDAGAAYVFVRTGTTWQQQAYLKASNTDPDDGFGVSVAIDGDLIAVGAWLEDSSATGPNGDGSDNSADASGAAYLFKREGPEWILSDYLKSSNSASGDSFGEALAVDGSRVAIAAPGQGLDFPASGAVYIFNVPTSLPVLERDFVKSTNPDAEDAFGFSVAMKNNLLIVGARREDSASAGVDGNQDDNGLNNSGAAYAFEFVAGLSFSSTGYLKASNTDVVDFMGGSVAIGDGFVAAGAASEDSSAVGINGDGDNNSAGAAGAVYAYNGRALRTVQVTADGLESGSGLRGRLNGGQDRVINGNAIFANQPLFDGDDFLFEITQQPTSPVQNCSPTSLSGTVQGASPELVISCTLPPSFTVGGTVSGLQGDGLELRLNGVDTLMIESNGAFVFGMEVRSGEGYGVEVASSPTGPDQFCAVNGGFGVMGDSSVTDIEVQCTALAPISDYDIQAYIKATNTDSFDQFATAMALDGDTLVVGADQEDSSLGGIGGPPANNNAIDTGAVYVYVRDEAGTWTPQSYIKASNPDDVDFFGRSVAISGDTLVVGAPGEDSNATGFNGNQFNNGATDSGAVYVYTRNASGQWFAQAYLKAFNTGSGDEFGSQVAIDGDTLVVGAPGESSAAREIDGDSLDDSAESAGAAYVFTRSGVVWSQQAYLKADNADADDRFGGALAIDGDRVVVGSSGEDSGALGIDGDGSNNEEPNAGAAYLFERFGDSWSQQAYLKAFNTGAGDAFGGAVDVDGDRIAVGAEREDGPGDSGSDTGAVYVFTEEGTGWSQAGYLLASNADDDDQFGRSVGMDGDRLVAGAWLEDSAAVGAAGNSGDNSLINSGAAYLFRLYAGAWQQERYLKAGVADLADQFGRQVAISNGLVVVGTVAEDSAAIGVGGDAADNSSSSAGAAYVFDASRYTIGGQVNGLLGSGLELQLNENERLSIAADGAFTFNARLPLASSYSVSVSNPPSGPDQSCRISNGTGEVPNQNVSNVQIDCSSGFRIGGTVFGAAGPGLVLQNNGGDDRIITANGPFLFAESVADGESYEVTVLSSPEAPLQECLVNNGIGTVQGQAVLDVQVLCRRLFRVRGQVVGAAGPGLVLQNNGGDDLVITANGEFEFSQALVNGDEYTVSVLSSPSAPPQSCHVTNNTGTVQAQDVTDVLVRCTTFYRIGGVASGIEGPGLVLQNNGQNDRAVSSNGAFAFSELLQTGSEYDVTVLSEPQDPEQICRAFNRRGTVGTADVTDIQVECRLARRIGGAVTGLEGSGLVLDLNGEAMLPISAQGPFQFIEPIANGLPYEVTVAAQPVAPEQLCTVQNGTGVALGGDVNDITVSCQTQGRPGQVQFDTALIEIDETGGVAMLQIERIGGTDGSISVRIESRSGTATDGLDYLPLNEVRSWADGDDTPWPVAVTLLDDGETEGFEQFEITISIEAGGAGLGTPSRATIRIFDDETVLFGNGFED